LINKLKILDLAQKLVKNSNEMKIIQLQHGCGQNFLTEQDLAQYSCYLGRQETTGSCQHDFELRECLCCGSSFAARELSKLQKKKTLQQVSLLYS
jgi:hypothetical protein